MLPKSHTPAPPHFRVDKIPAPVLDEYSVYSTKRHQTSSPYNNTSLSTIHADPLIFQINKVLYNSNIAPSVPINTDTKVHPTLKY